MCQGSFLSNGNMFQQVDSNDGMMGWYEFMIPQHDCLTSGNCRLSKPKAEEIANHGSHPIAWRVQGTKPSSWYVRKPINWLKNGNWKTPHVKFSEEILVDKHLGVSLGNNGQISDHQCVSLCFVSGYQSSFHHGLKHRFGVYQSGLRILGTPKKW